MNQPPQRAPLPPPQPSPNPSHYPLWAPNPAVQTSPTAQPVYWQYQHTTNGMAIAAIIATACTLVTGFGWVIGLVLGHIALNQLKHNPAQRGRNMALTAIVIGWSLLAITALIFVGLFLALLAGA